MKHFLLIFIFFSSISSFSQDGEEELVNFTSTLIDYEVYNDKVVAITKKNREYFLFYEDTKGAKLYESIDIFFATDLEIDCMGNLFLVGVDSAIQLDISDHVKQVHTLGIDAYKTNIRTCKALFEESLVRESFNNSLIYEPIDDSVYAKHPVLFTIQVWSDDFVSPGDNAPNPSRISADDATLQDDLRLNLRKDIVSQPRSNSGSDAGVELRRTYGEASELTAFQVGDSLWVFDENTELMLIYDEHGKSDGIMEIDRLAPSFNICQDRQNQEVYFLSTDGSRRLIQKVDVNGVLDKGVSFYKGFSRSSLKISNGHLYFRDSKGVGESIKRVRLN